MRIIFMGSPGFAIPSLKILLENKYTIPAVVTTPDRKQGRGLQYKCCELKQFAQDNGLRISEPEFLNDDKFIEELKSLNPDLFIVVAFRILPERVYKIPRYGSVNIHASLLPKYRGAAPINHVLINGEKETGVTSFYLEKKVDTGNIILQKKILIEDDDNFDTLHDKLSEAGAEICLETVKMIQSGNITTMTQDDSITSNAPKIYKEDCEIDWNKKAEPIHNLVRGLSSVPGAYTKLEGKSTKILRTALTNINSTGKPGELTIENRKLYVNTSDKMLDILELQPEGKKKMRAIDFINGIDKTKKYCFFCK